MGCSKAMTSSISKRRLSATSRLASSSSPYRRDFAISRYQSHISFQEKRYRALAASANSYFSYSPPTSSTTVSRRLNIQRSAGVDNETRATAVSGAPCKAKREAFQILLAKFLPISIRSELKRTSCTCLLYTSDAADDLTRVDLGGRRIIKKKKKKTKK